MFVLDLETRTRVVLVLDKSHPRGFCDIPTTTKMIAQKNSLTKENIPTTSKIIAQNTSSKENIPTTTMSAQNSSTKEGINPVCHFDTLKIFVHYCTVPKPLYSYIAL